MYYVHCDHIILYLVFDIKALITCHTSLGLFESDNRCIASPHPPPGSNEPLLCPEATYSQLPPADSPISYHSLRIVCQGSQ